MRKLILGCSLITLISCAPEPVNDELRPITTRVSSHSNDSGKINVLNFGSIHLSGSTDAHSSVTDIHDPQVKADIKKIIER